MVCGFVLFVVAWRRRVVRMAGKESFAPALLARALHTWRLAGASVRLADATRALTGEAQQLAEALASAEGSWEVCRDDLAASKVRVSKCVSVRRLSHEDSKATRVM